VCDMLLRTAVARCLDILRQMQQSLSRKNQFAEIGLSRLYDTQLTAKYAYTGFLGNQLLFSVIVNIVAVDI